MTQTTTENEEPAVHSEAFEQVSAVVQALLPETNDSAEVEGQAADSSGAADAAGELQAQVDRVLQEIDEDTAVRQAEILVTHLNDDGDSVRELEALIVLGLAYPVALQRHSVPLVLEGRRLALLLEQDGRVARAQALLELMAARAPGDRQIDHDIASMMRRNGNADRLIDRYMRRAEEAVAADRTKEAISWLQEILLVDRSRRDVARMIRDLRWGDQEQRRRLKRGVRQAVLLLILGAAAVAAVQRELGVAERFAELPTATEGNLASLRLRVDNLARFESEHPFSLQLWGASRERAGLKAEIAQLEAKSAQVQIARSTEREAQLAIAESARKQGRIFAQQNRFHEALKEFERALALGPGDWDQRERLQTDVAAIREWIVEHAPRNQGNGR
ncbi:MAG: hypothetical protein IPK67_14285 [Planctomycetes bacterium]|nr:hypothetical protein [Planctomycetota bacterium]